MLAVEPELIEFEAHQEAECHRYLIDVDERTMLVPIQSPVDVALDATGCRKTDGYRFSRRAYGQLCGRAAPGLVTLTREIGGLRESRHGLKGVTSIPVAAGIVNAVVQLRFRVKDGLEGMQLIQDNHNKRIEGLVGKDYRYLSNRALYEIATEAAIASAVPAKFYSCQLVGRRVALVFMGTANGFRVGAHEYRPGYYFANSEAGECSVKAAVILIRPHDGQRAMYSFQRLKHLGKHFRRNLSTMLGGLVDDADGATRLGDVAQKLLAAPLTLTTPGGKIDDPKFNRAVEAMVAHEVDRSTANEVLKLTLYGEVDTTLSPRQIPTALSVTKTNHDAFLRLLDVASRASLARRERLERVAYDLLSGKLRF